MTLTVKTEPASEPILVKDLKTHLRIISAKDDTYLASLIRVAREHIEMEIGRSLITRTYTATFDFWPNARFWRLEFPSIQSVTHIKYYDTTSAQQTFSADNYQVDDRRIILNYGLSWPDIWDEANGIEIEYVAGFGDDPEDIPEGVRLGIMQLIGYWYNNREEYMTSEGRSLQNVYLPRTVDALVLPFKDWR